MKIAATVIAGILVIAIALYYFLIGKTDKSPPDIVLLDEPIKVAGIEILTNDTAIYKDVGIIASKFVAIKEKKPLSNLKKPWASVNISKDYNPDTKTFTYIVGDVVTNFEEVPDDLNTYEVPPITYAVFKIKPKSRFAWGITMGRMKRFIYTEWLPESGYRPSEIIGDFELHDDRSIGKKPEIQLFVAIEKKDIQ